MRHLWHPERNDRLPPKVSVDAKEWAIRAFRSLWPASEWPTGVSAGSTNAWDATDFIRRLIKQLESDLSDKATFALSRLTTAAVDSYTPHLRFALDRQRSARRGDSFAGITLDGIKDVVLSRPPTTNDDLRAVFIHALKRLQHELRGNATDSVEKYWTDDGQPRYEDTCTNRLVEDLQRLLMPFNIHHQPQAQMPKRKVVDVLLAVQSGNASLPVECKGQWNRHLWTAPTDQLDAQYLRDWRSQDRGVYLVYWFGPKVNPSYKLSGKGRGRTAPRASTPDELRDQLIESLPPSRRSSIVVQVLDLTR